MLILFLRIVIIHLSYFCYRVCSEEILRPLCIFYRNYIFWGWLFLILKLIYSIFLKWGTSYMSISEFIIALIYSRYWLRLHIIFISSLLSLLALLVLINLSYFKTFSTNNRIQLFIDILVKLLLSFTNISLYLTLSILISWTTLIVSLSYFRWWWLIYIFKPYGTDI